MRGSFYGRPTDKHTISIDRIRTVWRDIAGDSLRFPVVRRLFSCVRSDLNWMDRRDWDDEHTHKLLAFTELTLCILWWIEAQQNVARAWGFGWTLIGISFPMLHDVGEWQLHVLIDALWAFEKNRLFIWWTFYDGLEERWWRVWYRLPLNWNVWCWRTWVCWAERVENVHPAAYTPTDAPLRHVSQYILWIWKIGTKS